MSLITGLSYFLACEEATGATRADSTANGLNFSSTNSVTQVVGKVGNGAGFVTNKKLSRASGALLQPGPDFTLAFWLFLNSVADGQTLMAKDDVASERQISVDIDGQAIRFIVFDSVSGLSFPAPAGVLVSTWYYVLCKYKSADKKPYLKVDNAAAVVGSALSNGIYTTGTSPVEFGDRAGGAQPLNGRLDQIAFYQRFTDDAEDTELWNGGAGLTYAQMVPPVTDTGLQHAMDRRPRLQPRRMTGDK